MINTCDVLSLEKAYQARGLATQEEREIEDKIFNPEASHTEEEITLLLRQYEEAKKKRATASINAAEAFMRAAPEIRKAADWRSFTPGHETDIGRGNAV